jgi:uncharacterized protein (TIGR02145 family)
MKRIVLYCVIAAALAAVVTAIIVLYFKAPAFNAHIEVRVENVPYDGLILFLYPDGSSKVYVGSFSNGVLSLTFPDTLPSEFLNPVWREINIDINDKKANIFMVDMVPAFLNGELVGYFRRRPINVGYYHYNYDSFFWYVDRKVEIRESAVKEKTMVSNIPINTSTVYSVYLKKGWNHVYKEYKKIHITNNYDHQLFNVFYSTTTPSENGEEWFFDSNDDGEDFSDECGDCDSWEEFQGDAEEDDIAIDNGNTFTDSRDGKVYKTIKIGEQVWMAENLNYEAEGSRCYNDSISYCNKYGKLYDWETAMKVCPKGWHLPNREEWSKLIRYVDDTSDTESPYESKTAGKYLKSKEGWNDDKGKSSNGEDKFGFSALPGGYGDSGGNFSNVGKYGIWWSSSEFNSSSAYFRYMAYTNEDVYNDYYDKSNLHSVRCVRD